jgi:predicted RNA-binding Zn ribbon-like protein
MSESDPQSLKLIAGRLCLDFINTVNCRNGDHPGEVLSTYPRLVSWSQHASILTDNEARNLIREASLHPAETRAALERAIAIREALYRIFSAIASRRSPAVTDTEMLNEEMSAAMAKRRLKPLNPPEPWTYTFEESRLDQMLWPVVLSAAELLTSDWLDRVSVCQGENCGWLFVDMSRNRSRKWCDMKDCGNVVKARRHYQKTRALGRLQNDNELRF